MATTTGRKVYVIRDIYWEYNDEYHDCHGEGEPVKAFTNRERAEEFWFQNELVAWRRLRCPVWYVGGFEMATSLTEEQLAAGLEQIGIPAPYRWADDAWWTEILARSPQLVRRVWTLFDKVRFYQLVEVELAPEQEDVA